MASIDSAIGELLEKLPMDICKKVFKKAVGDLYKQHLIVLKGDDGIYLA